MEIESNTYRTKIIFFPRRLRLGLVQLLTIYFKNKNKNQFKFCYFDSFNSKPLALLSLELELDDGTGFPSFTSGISLTGIIK